MHVCDENPHTYAAVHCYYHALITFLADKCITFILFHGIETRYKEKHGTINILSLVRVHSEEKLKKLSLQKLCKLRINFTLEYHIFLW